MTKKTMHVLRAVFMKIKMAERLAIMLLLIGSINLSAFAGDDFQQKRITGRITDASGEPLIGVNITEKGTTNGSISEATGNFSINTTTANPVLTFSFIGYVTQEITVGTRTNIDFMMNEAVSALDEIVVVGYSTQSRKTLTGSVAQVDAAVLAESAATNPMTRLQGKVSGVTILNQHTPGEGSTIRIRGMTTINDSNPLYVVDGVPDGSYSPNDVETITILKDAAAQSIYGARAANGVVLITTKGGRRNQKISMNFNVRQGITQPGKFYDLLNTQEWAEMLWLEVENKYNRDHADWAAGLLPVGTAEPVLKYDHPQFGVGPAGTRPVIPAYLYPTGASSADMSLYDNKLAHEDGDDTYLIAKTSPGTDWFGETTRNAAFKEYTIDIAGGSSNTTYAFLLGYTDEEGIFKYTGFERYSGRVNIHSSPAKWIDLGTTIGLNYTKDYGHQTDNGETSMVSWSYRLPTAVPVWDESGTTYAGSRSSRMGNAQNPMFLLDTNQWDETKRMTVSGNAYLKLNLVKGLSVKTLIGVNQYGQYNNDYNFVEVAAAERGTYDYFGKGANFGLNWTWTNTIEYGIVSGQHNIKAIAGTEAYNNTSTSLSGSRDYFPFKDIDYMSVGTGLRAPNAGDGNSSYSLFSIFGRINYTLADKYLIEAVVRRDGSSRFGNEKFGVFPAFSAGWRLTQEGFMASTRNWLNDAKIRVGYGVVGNDRMGNYNSFTNFAYHEQNASYGMTGGNNAYTLGFYQSTFGNPDVRWETTSTTNFGFDATLINNFTITLDIWQRQTRDMLYPKQLPMVLGMASRPSINIGTMKNTGFDLELGYNNAALNGDLTYGVDLVFSHYSNELVKLTDVETDFYQGGGYREKYYTRTETGRAFPEFFGYIVEGIFQSDAEASEWPAAFGSYNKAGHFKYRDVNNDEVINSSDRTYIGSPHPDFTAGLSLNLGFKGITLTTTLYASVGNEIANYVSRFIDYTQFESGKSTRRLYESWGSPYLSNNLDATMPIIYQNDTPHQEPSTAFLENGSFLRMKTLRIGYDVNRLLKNKLDAKTLQIYFQGSNLFTMTKYSGLDPEISGAGINMGIDSGAWPTSKQFLFGISFGL